MTRARVAAVALWAALGCSGADSGAPDATILDAAPPADAGQSEPDAGLDAGAVDAGPAICAGGVCSGACCEAHNAAGCDDLDVTRCVCAVRPDCCRLWTNDCVDVAIDFQCAACERPGAECGNGQCEGEGNETCLSCPADCGACEGDCCAANDTPGCSDATVAACVCEFESICCTAPWDEQCVSAVERRGCGGC